MSDGQTITLKKPVKAHGEEVKSLTFREPTGADIMAHGYPVVIKTGLGGGIQVVIDAASAGAMMSELAGVPASSIKALSLADFNAAAAVLFGFFGESISALFSTGTSTLENITGR